MGFRYDSNKRRDKSAVRKANGFQMIMVLIILAFSVWLGWWLPGHVDVRQYVPIPLNWPDLAVSILAGLSAFILLQFVVVFISGILFPLPPKDKYDETGMYKRD